MAASKQSKVEVEVAVLQTKIDHIEESIHGIRDQLSNLDGRIVRLEKLSWSIGGILLFLNLLPHITPFL